MATYGGYLSKLQIGNKYYDIFDKEAREMLSQVLVFAGVTTAAIADNASTPSTYGGLTGISTYPIDPTTGEPHIATDTIDNGTVVIYDSKEFVWQGGKWHEFGDLYEWTPTLTKDSVLGADTTFTPATTSTATTGTSTHSHQILKNDIVQAFQVTNVHAAASAPAVTPTTTSNIYGLQKAFRTLTKTSQSTTPGTAASATLAPSVVTGLTNDTTASGGIAYVSSLNTTSNKLNTGSQSGSVQGTVITGISASGTSNKVITDVGTGAQSGSVQSTVVTGLTSGSSVLTSFTAGSTPYVATMEGNDDIQHTGSTYTTFTLVLDEGTAPSATNTTLKTGSQSLSLQSTVATGSTPGYLSTGSQSLSLQSTVATGSVSELGTGAAIPTANTRYLHTSATNQSFTANTPTAVTLASSVATGVDTADDAGDNNFLGNVDGLFDTVLKSVSVAAPTITLSKPTGTTATGDIQLINNQKSSGDYISTSTDGSHTHNYDKTTSITVGTNDLVDAVTNVTLS